VTTDDDRTAGWLDRIVRRLLGNRDNVGKGHLPRLARRAKRVRTDRQEWVLLESVHAAALGSLHQQVLNREGIPALVREWGGGSAVLGGVPVGVSLFVPGNRLGEALALLGLDAALDATLEGKEHEG
jgi:hypothetical protein